MARYLLRRFVFLLVSLALASVVLFALLRLLPGDPANALTSVGASPEQIAAARHSIGSDQPLPEQFTHWLGQLVSGDLGTSFVSTLPVGPEVASRLDLTIPLTLAAFVLAVLIAVPAGFVAAYKRHTWYGALLSGVSQLGIAVPVFWLGMILVAVFALNAGWLPAGGFPPDGWAVPGEAVRSLVLPVVTIALVMSASLIRYVRSATLDVLGSDYLRTARALGSSFGQAMWRHGLRNASVPVVSVLGIELASTLLGAVVVESVFALPGLGSMLVTGIAQHDYPVVQGVLFVSTLAVLLIGFAADLVQRVIDPRLRDRLSGGTR
ncbi:ABC transporter permease [Streptomyces halstedii]|uniref:ABC transporter permease n=1 Tax=Streptomyces TaxID=1883 RepID=UPI00048DC296|nr:MULTISPECIES: ABC transporter permease [Streptomyces]MYR71686.1 ABC transporter permease subunit [Streptomyces sp. SID4925]MYY14958.1 ABC transporter permease subunit [Streptomyces sp. SID4912]SBV01395.1 peptide/nickel transport system permease protein [Streptomyces sp. OspMP-M45]SCD69739.1 peptide/nickel transport system permease protein [Streptomyces sp. PpalLS-921]SCD72360.1 peptide/nickel transport system permease protein [Streptomyces sp. DpondAA-D4]